MSALNNIGRALRCVLFWLPSIDTYLCAGPGRHRVGDKGVRFADALPFDQLGT